MWYQCLFMALCKTGSRINQSIQLMPKWASVIHRSTTQLKTKTAKQCYTHVVSNFTKIWLTIYDMHNIYLWIMYTGSLTMDQHACKPGLTTFSESFPCQPPSPSPKKHWQFVQWHEITCTWIDMMYTTGHSDFYVTRMSKITCPVMCLL
jgi:hypothetical protein